MSSQGSLVDPENLPTPRAAQASRSLIVSDADRAYEPFPLTDMQQAYWLGRTEEFGMGAVSGHTYLELEAPGLDITRLNLALELLIQEQAMLRAIVLPDGRQQILKEVPAYRIKVDDLSSVEPSDRDRCLASTRERMSHQVLPSESWPLFEIRASQLPGRVRLHMSLDMLILDGWSSSLFFMGLLHFYENPDQSLDLNAVSFRDYVLALEREKSKNSYQQSWEYWKQRLDEFPTGPGLPWVQDPDTITKPRFTRRSLQFDAEHWSKLKANGEKLGLTPTRLLMTAYAEVLAQWSKTDRFLITLPFFNRLPLHPRINEIIGDFTSLWLLEVDASSRSTFLDRGLAIRDQLRRDRPHIQVNGAQIVRELSRRRRGAVGHVAPAVFTSIVNYDSRAGLEGLELVYCVSQTPQVWIDAQSRVESGALFLDWDTADDIFPSGMMDDMFAAYGTLIGQLGDEAAWHHPVPELLPSAQKRRRRRYNATSTPVPAGMLHTRVLEQALRSPERLAVISECRELTYRELIERANAVARHLKEHDVEIGELVAVLMRKGWQQVVAVLGVQLAGAAYLPIGADLPSARIDQLMQEGRVRQVLTESIIDGLDPDAEGLLEFEPLQGETDLAYVIFTSGSTGVPKGVMIDHVSALNTVEDINRRFEIAPSDRILGLSSLSFDLSVYDIFGALIAGATLVLPEHRQEPDPADWLNRISRHGVTVWNSVPALMEMLLDVTSEEERDKTQDLRLVLLSGDWVPTSLPDRIRASWHEAEIISLGGATEASIWSICHPTDDAVEGISSIPYGRPLANQSFHVLSSSLLMRPEWVPGELYIGGRGLASGYWKDPERSDAAFVTHPDSGERLYRTGDWGRQHPDGFIEFLGREDLQVKVGGHRVELGEIEAVLQQHPGVKHALVQAFGPARGHKRLVGYIVPEPTRDSNLFREQDDTQSSLNWDDAIEAGRAAALDLPVRLVRNEFEEAMQQGGALLIHYLCRVLRVAGLYGQTGECYTLDEIIERGGVQPEFSKWLRRCVGYLVEEGWLEKSEQGYLCTRVLPHLSVDEIWQRFGSELPESLHSAGVDWARRSGEGLDQVLRGKAHAVELLFPDGDWLSAESSYQFGFDECNRVASEAIQVAIASLPDDRPLRILEIGAGVGACTRAVLPLLPADRTEYYYTDISRYFFSVGRKNFRDYPFVQYAILDIEKDVESQGFKAHSFDLVIAASVLHATDDLAKSVGNLRSLLAPGGIAALIELTQMHRVFELTMGLQQGFDRFTDTDLRPEHSLLSRKAWSQLLSKQGFDDVEVLANPDANSGLLGTDLVLARASDVTRSFDDEHLRVFLGERLPEYMIPSVLVPLTELPLACNGKVMRSLLPAPASLALASSHYVAPRNPTEEAIAKVWMELLEVDRIGVHGNFFELGGDSLVATQALARLREILQQRLPLRWMFKFPTVAELANAIEQTELEVVDSGMGRISKQSRDHPLPLSFSQERLWFLDQLQPSNIAYNVPSVRRLLGQLDRRALEDAIDELVRCHETLRTRFVLCDDVPHQEVRAHRRFELEYLDLTGTDPRESVEQWVHEPMDLSAAPLMRARLIRIGEADHVLALVIHHIAIDGSSLTQLHTDLADLYRRNLQGGQARLEEPEIQFADYAVWQRSRFQADEMKPDLDYWRRKLADLRSIDLPHDHARPAMASFKGRSHCFEISPELTLRLRQLGASEASTLYMVLLASFQAYLARYSGQDDIAVGTPIANRPHPQVERVLGFFANTLVLRTDLSGDPTLRETLQRVRETALEAYAHQQVPFEKLVEDLQPIRDLSRNPLFQIAMSMLPLPGKTADLDGLSSTPLDWEMQTAKFDLHLAFFELPSGGLHVRLEYSTDLFEHDRIELMAEQWTGVLEAFVESPDQVLKRVPMLTDGERELIAKTNGSKLDLPAGTVLDLFAQQVLASAAETAVRSGEEEWSYIELERMSNTIANRLTALGVRSGHRVGLSVGRSIELIAGMIGILKTGAAYVPLDSEYPAKRLASMRELAGVQHTLTEELIASALAVEDSGRAGLPLSGTDLAYVMFTSGSSGQPKGVEMSHAALLNLILWQLDRTAAPRRGRTLQFASPSFDVSFQEIFSTLCAGGELVLISDRDRRDVEALWEVMIRYRVERLYVTYAMLQELTRTARGLQRSSLREVCVAGEPLKITDEIRKFALRVGCSIDNHYGPTETHVVTAHRLEGNAATWESLPPIGQPIANVQIHILDSDREPVPLRVSGEIYVGGLCVADGYASAPDSTSERFLDYRGQRVYRTGDLGRYRMDGSIEFLGRWDHQIKLRGYRIELSEIETVLQQHADIEDAAVLLHLSESGSPRLVGYVAAPQALTVSLLHAHLAASLPSYMIPSDFVVLPSLPLNPNGKVDRIALPHPSASPRPELDSNLSKVERAVIEILSDILGVSLKLGDDFFEMGGHSLVATKAVSRLGRRFSIRIPVRTVFDAPRIEYLAKRIERIIESGTMHDVPIRVDSPKRPAPAATPQFLLWLQNKVRALTVDQPEMMTALSATDGTFTFPLVYEIFGKIDLQALQYSINQLIERHEVLRTTLVENDGVLEQIVHPPQAAEVGCYPITPDTDVAQLIKDDLARGFDLECGPLVRASLFQLDGEHCYLVIGVHHMSFDGGSIEVLQRELSTLYEAAIEGRSSPLQALPVQYSDYGDWQMRYGAQACDDRKYWIDQLAGLEPLKFPVDHFDGDESGSRILPLQLPNTLAHKLRQLSRQNETTLFTTMLSAFHVLSVYYSGVEDSVVFSMAAKRQRPEVEGLIGFFAEPLFLRTNLAGDPAFREVMRSVKRTVIDSYDHCELPFRDILESVPGFSLTMARSRSVTFQMFKPPETLELAGLRVVNPSAVAGLHGVDAPIVIPADLMINLYDAGDQGIVGCLMYNKALWEEASMVLFMQRFERVVRLAVDDPATRLSEFHRAL